MSAKISIIIPVLNEEMWVGKLISHLEDMQDEHAEIIFADGGSTDKTIALIGDRAKVISSEKGRAKQMNAGAKNASGDILYFLHVDSLPPEHFDTQIRRAVAEGFVFGCFRMHFDMNHWFLRCSGWLTRFNSSWCRGGDQSLFVTRTAFEKSGGFDERLIIYEDNEILPRIAKWKYFRVIPDYIITSARKYRTNGVFRLQYIFFQIHLRYRLGFSQDQLLNYYRKKIK